MGVSAAEVAGRGRTGSSGLPSWHLQEGPTPPGSQHTPAGRLPQCRRLPPRPMSACPRCGLCTHSGHQRWSSSTPAFCCGVVVSSRRLGDSGGWGTSSGHAPPVLRIYPLMQSAPHMPERLPRRDRRARGAGKRRRAPPASGGEAAEPRRRGPAPVASKLTTFPERGEAHFRRVGGQLVRLETLALPFLVPASRGDWRCTNTCRQGGKRLYTLLLGAPLPVRRACCGAGPRELGEQRPGGSRGTTIPGIRTRA